MIESTTYYPFGLPIPVTSNQLQTYRFGFNGMESDDEITGTQKTHYTAPFWEYDTRIARRWNVDPVDKPHESSYLAFSGNPVLMIDPNGDNADGYTVNKDGCFEKVDDTGGDSFDVIYSEESYKNGIREFDDVGADDKGIIVEKGVIQGKENIIREFEGGAVETDMLDMTGRGNANELYSFLASNTDVEWSLMVIKINKSVSNEIRTSHETNRDMSSGSHSHPNQNPTGPSPNDIDNVDLIKGLYPNSSPVFEVLNATTLETTKYNENSVSFILPESTVRQKRPNNALRNGRLPRLKPKKIINY